MIRRSVVIVGAGPAGMSAALALCRAGLKPTVIDDNHDIGGQIYRAPLHQAEPSGNDTSPGTTARGNELRQEFRRLGSQVELLTDTAVWGIFPPRQLAINRADGWQLIDADHLILATGAYEFVSPFPGWTLPGVMTPGAAQLMVKTMRVLPGPRVLVAGSGPFLYVVANQLRAAGVEVVGVVEAIRRRDLFVQMASLMSHWGLLREGLAYVRQLQKEGIPIHWGHMVTEAHSDGDDVVSQVVVSQCDSQWRPLRKQPTIYDVNTLCVGFGFVPRVDLTQMTGCRMKYSEHLGGWIPVVDENLQTSVPGVWVAGDGGGVAGALVAELEGTLAGLSVAHTCCPDDADTLDEQRGSVQRRLSEFQRFRAALDRAYRIRPGLETLATDETIVCRCEELSRREIEAGISYGGTDIRALKVMTRLGMGPCQGKMCWPAVARIVAGRAGITVESCGPLSVRPPANPLCVGDLLSLPSMSAADGGTENGKKSLEDLPANH